MALVLPCGRVPEVGVTLLHLRLYTPRPHLGIMLLEKQLLSSINSGGSPPAAKRARGAAKPLPKDTEVWVELSR